MLQLMQKQNLINKSQVTVVSVQLIIFVRFIGLINLDCIHILDLFKQWWTVVLEEAEGVRPYFEARAPAGRSERFISKFHKCNLSYLKICYFSVALRNKLKIFINSLLSRSFHPPEATLSSSSLSTSSSLATPTSLKNRHPLFRVKGPK